MLQLGACEIYSHGEADEQHPEGYGIILLSAANCYLFSSLCSRFDAAFIPWSTGLRQQLLDLYPLHEGTSPIPDDFLLQPRWTLALAKAMPNERDNWKDGKSLVNDRARFNLETSSPMKGPIPSESTNRTTQTLQVTLEMNRRITAPDHWQDVRHLVFRSHTPANYDPGDVLTVYPKNRADEVDSLINSMHWTGVADKPVQFVSTSRPLQGSSNTYPPVGISQPPDSDQQQQNTPRTLRTLLTTHLDLTAIPRRSFFSKTAHFAQDPVQKARLLEFAQSEYLDELYDYTTRPRRSILEVLQEFDSVRIPWQWAANILPALRGRQFSIASGGPLKTYRGSGGGHGDEARFELLVAIVKYKTVIKKIREGVCTRYLAALPAGTELQVLLQRGGLGTMVRDEPWRPIVMIGPGTGVAPLRSLIWERFSCSRQLCHPHPQRQTNGSGHPRPQSQPNNTDKTEAQTPSPGKSMLFFGCRNPNSDFFFKDEWTELQQQKMDLQVFAAFSRDTPNNNKTYVQDLIKAQSELVFRLLCKEGGNGIVYVCGSSGNMPLGVWAALVEVFRLRGGMDGKAAEGYLGEMEREGRYLQETW
jgi:sulfite reductase alpha subunit-like flavoprotein